MSGYGCKFGLPHDLELLNDTRRAKWERCRRCCKTFRWTKGFRGRINNAEYLRAHARNYAQPGGKTNRLYQKLYHPERCIIRIS